MTSDGSRFYLKRGQVLRQLDPGLDLQSEAITSAAIMEDDGEGEKVRGSLPSMNGVSISGKQVSRRVESEGQ